MSCPTCRYFDECNAPLCPEDPSSLENAAWFGDEDVCRRADYRTLPIVQVQRRIARLTGGDTGRGCFTVPMLEQGCRLTRAIRGLDPEAGPTFSDRVARWLREHPPKRALTEAERAVRRARVAKMRARNTGAGAESDARTRAQVTPSVQIDLFSAGVADGAS